MRLYLESATDSIDLAEIEDSGWGAQATAGLTGFGLPPVQVRWAEGAGHGAKYRGTRVLPRDIDMPIHLFGRDRQEVSELASRLSRMLAGECLLRASDPVEGEWRCRVVRVGGGDYVYGDPAGTTGGDDLSTVVTLRAGDPFWQRVRAELTVVQAASGRGLLRGTESLTQMRLSSSQAYGAVSLTNSGDVESYPFARIEGPATGFTATSPDGLRKVRWTGTLAVDETLTFDFRRGVVVDHAGASRYHQLDKAPTFWTVPPGSSTATLSLDGATAASSIWFWYNPRKWLIV